MNLLTSLHLSRGRARWLACHGPTVALAIVLALVLILFLATL